MPALEGPRLAPASGGPAKQLVILLHGYGADGNDLIGLGAQWAPLLPDAAFVSPNAPHACGMSPMGREWFPLEARDVEEYARGVAEAKPILNAFVDAELERNGLTPNELALVGFSQGTMMALAVGLSREKPPAAILGYSGTIAAMDFAEDIATKAPRILLVHGDMDPVIPLEAHVMTRNTLGQLEIAVECHVCQGLGHGIDQQGLMLGGGFLKQSLTPNA
ncbi:dienelactone hydrolase family protein [Methyloligella sp. GL2]|nr:dienelactone hydrolase family protein [Methyloligella sp. GL2]QKP78683.1 dienelactone hydrolase family protein [Methyloligella sp. GL2]